MRFGDAFAVNYMSRNNDALWLWLDVKLGRFWYVFMWHKGQRPYLYRSTDATPPVRWNDLFGTGPERKDDGSENTGRA